MREVTEEKVKDALPAIAKATEGIENGFFFGVIHQGEITKVQGFMGDPERIINRSTGRPTKK